MLNIDYIVDKSLNEIIYALEVFGGGALPNTAQAVQRSADMAVGIWSNIARGAFKHSTGAYLHAIEKGLIYPYNNDRFQAAVINRLPYAKYIENGTGQYDLKNMLKTSDKVRVSKKDGKRYLIIPFRHGAPGSVEFTPMPKAVHQGAVDLEISRKRGAYMAPSQQQNAAGVMVRRYLYRWGGRLSEQTLTQSGVMGDKRQNWKSSKYEGMVRFPRDSGTPGGKYLTFRVMKEDEKGWIKPPVPGQHLAAKTQQAAKFVVSRAIRQGFEKDIETFTRMYL